MTAPIFTTANYATLIQTDPLEVSIIPPTINLETQQLGNLGGVFVVEVPDVTAFVLGGLAPYTYEWSSSSSVHDVSALTPNSPTTSLVVSYSGTGFQTAIAQLRVADSLGNEVLRSLSISAFISSIDGGIFS